MTINHHLSRHYLKFIRLFGPIYGWWLFAFERFNGMLEKVKHNGHDGGWMELTLMRNWVMSHQIYEYLLALPDDAPLYEKQLIDTIIRTEARKAQGGIMTDLAIYRAEANADNNVKLPRRLGSASNIAEVLPDGNLNITSDTSMEPGTPFYRSCTCHALTYIRKDGIWYGSTSNRRTQADSFAFISNGQDRRIPVQIISLLSIKLAEKPPHVCAIVHRLSQDDNIPLFPWDL
ncbi:hypothetical protein C0992_008597, partial [Termitomyces sp. T32_za158]